MTTENIRICIVEDDPEFQEWIMEEIDSNPALIAVGMYDTAEEALLQLPPLQPDIVIMDLGLERSEMQGLECMLRLKLVAPKLKFLVLTSNSDESIVFEALKVGASAYLQKSDIPRKLNELLMEFHQGGAPMSPGIALRVIQSFHQPQENLRLLNSLSPRESDILDELSKGLLYKEIADKFDIKEGTVKAHAHSIYRKLQVNNRTEAINKYLNH